ncbi:SDR family NAD(P)-dependent oxidoreductase [Halopseudomonas aestusnigri]|uniref:3-oxoacyl-[acyl-carrier protein] reductase n=1 Tax=Halopseudomonas aestusnigri TaxID=857252 RepID=A0AAQ1G716_9GAMM|nr:3-oxoacyl-ACP reductase family protein [Halopseudomonas aestusnigri]OWL89205.1 3-oxoacyl-ACP reductase [Halopseudomonas aestusnigri]SEG05203.1 3-oxoacyl-[acyl-carrier protein] reductase [Halopseudomonas aestusnigri]
MKLNNKIAFVTGAAQGMGAAIVREFVAEGAIVYAADINEEAISASVAEYGDKARAVVCNVMDEASVQAAMQRISDEAGRLDVLVNNAGTGSVDSFLDTPVEHWDRVVGVNLKGSFLCAREAARLMVNGGIAGSIINFSSTGAVTGEGPSHYVASKAGVMGLTRSLARELAPQKIRVNTIVPGPTDTPMMAGIPDEWMQSMVAAIPLGRLGQPAEIARAVVFLASDDASFVTGQNLTINGGSAFL